MVVSSESLSQVGLFSTDFKAAENWDLWLRICKVYTARVVSDPLIKYRIHSDNMSGDGQLMLRAKLQIIEKHCDVHSEDAVIARYSRRAYADYHYREGLNYFAAGQYQHARKEFITVLGFSLFYEDTWTRLLRSFLGAPCNRFLHNLK